MKVLLIFCGLILLCFIGQSQELTLGQKVDSLTYAWDAEEKELETYDGLLKFCSDTEYRNHKIQLLNEIHHIDSVLYERALIASKRSKDHEIDRLIKEIEKFEKKYSMRSFLQFLRSECKAEKSLEKESDELNTDFGSESYDGQVYIIEVELQKHVKHITKRIDHIRKHVHKLNIE